MNSKRESSGRDIFCVDLITDSEREDYFQSSLLDLQLANFDISMDRHKEVLGSIGRKGLMEQNTLVKTKGMTFDIGQTMVRSSDPRNSVSVEDTVPPYCELLNLVRIYEDNEMRNRSLLSVKDEIINVLSEKLHKTEEVYRKRNEVNPENPGNVSYEDVKANDNASQKLNISHGRMGGMNMKVKRNPNPAVKERLLKSNRKVTVHQEARFQHRLPLKNVGSKILELQSKDNDGRIKKNGV